MSRRHKALFDWKKKSNFRKSVDYHHCCNCAYFTTTHEHFYHNKPYRCEKIKNLGVFPNGVSEVNAEKYVCDYWTELSLERQLGWN
jgi:hypothetical protein